MENAAIITVMGLYPDGAIRGVTFWMPVDRIAAGAELAIGVDADVGGAIWTIPAGGVEPEGFIPVTAGSILLSKAGTEPGAAIAATIYADFGDGQMPDGGGATGGAVSGSVEVRFETAWGTNKSLDPFAAGGSVSYLVVDGAEESFAATAVIGGHAGPDESALLPGVDNPASLTVIAVQPDGSMGGIILVVPSDELARGAVLVIGKDTIAGGVWTLPPGGVAPDNFWPFIKGTLTLSEASTAEGAAISGSFSGRFGDAALPTSSVDATTEPVNIGLVINEVAAKGDPLDWFELHNTLSGPIGLFAFLVADDLTDASKRVAFPPGTEIQPGEYLRFEVDNDNWAGFRLGSDEELGIWLQDGTLVAMVDWDEGDSGEGESYARIPDSSGEFQTVGNPTPGTANRP